MRRTICSAFFLLCLCSVAFAQEESLKVPQASATPLITAGSSADRVRFAAPGTVVQMHLQVYADSGQILFDTTSKGNVLDWTVQDGSGERLKTGSYVCVVTVKSLNGKLSQRIGEVSVDENRTELRVVDLTRVTAALQREVGPVEEDSALSVLRDDESEAATVIAHNGEEGQIIRGRGALSFRLGDFFSGKDMEQMRLTAEGNLGIGLRNPAAKLDVDGLIRASQGIVFPDGSIQLSASRKTLGARSLPPGESQKKSAHGEDIQTAALDVSGIGTTGKLPKWLDGPNGVLNDSNIAEVSGAIGINGAPNTGFRLDVNGSTRIRGSNPGFNLEGLSASGNIWLFQTVDNDGRFRLFGQDSINPGVERLTISLSTGNIGIGSTVPAAKLDVAGDIRSGAMRQELTASTPNLIAGFMGTGSGGATPGNRADAGVVGATIGGGGFNGTLNPPSGGTPYTGNNTNRVSDWFGTVGGGFNNRAGNNDATLDNADFATVGGGRGNDASGGYATVGGGQSNTASGAGALVAGGFRNIASQLEAAVVGGSSNTASGFAAFVGGGESHNATESWATVGGGQGNTASGTASTVAGGFANTASNFSATVGGGESNTANSYYSVVPGGNMARANHYGQMAFASGSFEGIGDAQTSVFVLRTETSSATLQELSLNGGEERITIGAGRALAFEILVVAKADAGPSAGYYIRGVIRNSGGTTSFIGTPTVITLGEDNSLWDIVVQADDTNDALVVKALGVSGVAIRWVASVRTAEVSF